MPRCEMCEEWPDCPWKTDPEIMCSEYHPKPMTNADRIRSMSDEELAMFLDDVQKYQICCKPIICEDCADCMTDLCWKCWRAWLKSPVEVDK